MLARNHETERSLARHGSALVSRRGQLHRWRLHGRIRTLRRLAARVENLRWSPRLLFLVLEELNVDDGFVDLLGPSERLPVRRYPQATAVAIALRHSWRPDDLSRVARRFHLPPTGIGRSESFRRGRSVRRRRRLPSR